MKTAAIIAPNSLPVPPIRGGGIQSCIAEMIKHYRNYQPLVFSICEPGVDALPLLETDGNVEHRRIRLTGLEEFMINLRHLSRKSYFPYVFKIIEQLNEIKPDIIHVMNRPWFLPILRKHLAYRAKIIEHNHNNYFMEMGKREVKSYLALMDAFAGASRFTVENEVLKRFPEEKDRCFVLYNGVNTEKFRPKWERRETASAVRHRFGISEDDIVILFVGRLTQDKGIDTLLDAFRKILPEHDNTRLLIAGSRFFGADNKATPFMKKLYAEAQPLKDKVIFSGFIKWDEIQDFYSAADMLAVPSHMEAFGLIYAEAGACGLPSIATKRGAIPEIVLDGETGLLIDDPNDANALKEKIRYFIENPGERQKFGQRARARMEEHFTWELAARRTESVYDQVIRQK